MRKVFYSDDLNSRFLSKGYVVVPFFDTSEVSEALEIFERHTLGSDKAFYLSIWDNDVPSRMAVHRLIQPLVHRRAEDILVDYKFLISCFAVKVNTPASAWSLHQDDSFTDESRFESLSIWVALTDVDASNGAMQVLDGSHDVFAGPRAPTIPKMFRQDDEALHRQMKTVNMKAGEACIFNHRLLHGSGANTGPAPRIASVSVMIPDEAPLWFYYQQNGKVDIIRLEEDYYLKFKLGDRPEGIIEQVRQLSELMPQEATSSSLHKD